MLRLEESTMADSAVLEANAVMAGVEDAAVVHTPHHNGRGGRNNIRNNRGGGAMVAAVVVVVTAATVVVAGEAHVTMVEARGRMARMASQVWLDPISNNGKMGLFYMGRGCSGQLLLHLVLIQQQVGLAQQAQLANSSNSLESLAQPHIRLM